MEKNYLWKYIVRYWKQFAISIFFITLETFGDLIQPTVMSNIIDKGVKNSNLDYVFKYGGLMLLLTACGAICATIRNITSSKVSQNFGADLREDLFKKIQSFSFDNIDEFQDASLIIRLTNDINQIQNFAHGLMRIFIKAPILGIGSIIMAFSLNVKMGFIFLSVVPIVIFIISLNLKISYPIFGNIQKSLDKVNGVMREYLAGIRVVKAFNRFEYEKDRFRKVNQELRDKTIGGLRTIAVFSPLVALTVNIGIVCLLWFGGLNVNNGDLEVGKIMAFVNYMTQLLFSLNIMTRVLNVFIRAKASSDRISEVFQAKSTIEEKVEVKQITENKTTLEFKNVDFKYIKNSNLVLKNINFRIEQGKILAIIGSTGSGKTSLVNLIPRFYDVEDGEVLLNNINIKDLSIKDLRDKIAVVPQKSLLFTGSIKDNIKWGNDKATDENVIEVSKIAEAHNFIEKFNDGYDTYIGQGGVNLSGGQKQRISIARALIKKPKVLILDDSTSAVDLVTERKIREAFKTYLKDTITILIAQRITSVINADKILVMDRGSIVGEGTHDELMKTCEVYMDIYNSQLGKGGLTNGS